MGVAVRMASSTCCYAGGLRGVEGLAGMSHSPAATPASRSDLGKRSTPGVVLIRERRIAGHGDIARADGATTIDRKGALVAPCIVYLGSFAIDVFHLFPARSPQPSHPRRA